MSSARNFTNEVKGMIGYICDKVQYRRPEFIDFIGDELGKQRLAQHEVATLVEIALTKAVPYEYVIGCLRNGFRETMEFEPEIVRPLTEEMIEYAD